MIINADDFGLSSAVNHAIVRGFEHTLCSSTTIMANMAGFEEACGLSHQHRLLQHVGLHLNLAEGFPLTENLKRCPRLCNSDGRFTLTGPTSAPRWLSFSEELAVGAEIRAQISLCRSNGLPLTHLDSHHHVHVAWCIGRIVISIAKESGIRYIRLARNCGPNIGLAKRVYKNWFNKRIENAGLARTRYFGSLTDYRYVLEYRTGTAPAVSFEIMVHPRLCHEREVLDQVNVVLNTAVTIVKDYSCASSFTGHKYRSTSNNDVAMVPR